MADDGIDWARDDLRHAQVAMALVRARDPRAWPIAEALAERDVAHCTRALVNAMRKAHAAEAPIPADVAVLITAEDGLRELFGAPDSERRARRARAA